MRAYTPDDYPLLVSWWKGHDKPPFPEVLLPSTGLVNECAAGFVYLTNSGMALIDGLISDPCSDKIKRHRALDELLPALIQLAEEQGAQMVVGTSAVPPVVKRAESLGFGTDGLTYRAFFRRTKWA